MARMHTWHARWHVCRHLCNRGAGARGEVRSRVRDDVHGWPDTDTDSGEVSRGYNGEDWERARALALRRAHYHCAQCPSTQGLEVHHIDGRGPRGPRGLDQSNLVVLCHRHHNARDRGDMRSPNATAVYIRRAHLG
jgi:5-methylcytosine-specific restriction endonuclease McrA